MRKAKLIYNPNSGEKSIVNSLDFIISIYQKNNITLIPYRIDKNECIDKAFLDIDNTYEHLIIAGGDGTIDIIINAMKNNDIFIITHPGDKGDVYIEEIAKVAKNTDTRLEINSSHGFLNSSQLVKIKGIGNKFIIGSDAHIPQNVGNFDLAMKIVKEASVDLSLIENIKI